MSDLTTFRDHARAMSKAKHKPECDDAYEDAYLAQNLSRTEFMADCPRACPGCVTDDDRALWARLADEADAYQSRHAEEGLFA